MHLPPFRPCIFAIVMASSFSGCNLADDQICIASSSLGISETILVDAFTSIDVQDVARVYLSNGKEQEVRVVAEQEVQENMEITVVNEVLIVKLDGCFDGPVTYDVFVTVPEKATINRVSVSNSAVLRCETPVKVFGYFDLTVSEEAELYFFAANSFSAMNLEVSGSGDVEVAAECLHTQVDLSGAGNVTLTTSRTNWLDVSSSGSGTLHAFAIPAETITLDIAGSGDVEVFIDEGSIEAEISGAGSVYFKGSPTVIRSNITGTGQVINAN